MGPVGRDGDEDAAGGLRDLAGHFDQARSPSFDVALAERILLAASRVVATPFASGQGFDGRGGVGHGHRIRIGVVLARQRRWVGHNGAKLDEEVQRGGVELEPEVVGHEPVAAQAIPRESGLEFVVAALAFAAFDVVVVPRLGKDGGTGTIGHDEASVGPLLVAFRFDDHAARVLPTSGSVQKLVEEPHGFPDLLKLRHGSLHQRFGRAFEHGIGGEAERSRVQSGTAATEMVTLSYDHTQTKVRSEK